MPHLIDGHNLIGRSSRISLSDPEDEIRLLELLSDHFRRIRRNAIVFFDNGAPGTPAIRRGRVEARFVTGPRTADEAILHHLRKQADRKAWIAVTSDAELQGRIRSLGARVINAEDFLRTMSNSPVRAEESDPSPADPETDFWLDAFQENSPPHSPDS